MSQVRLLANLQTLDTQLDNIRHRLTEIDAALSDHSAVRKAAARAEKAAAALTAARLALKRAEQEVQTQQDKIDRNQQALYGGGKSPKQLEELQMESGALARHLETLEERQLEALIASEEAEVADQAAQENLASTKSQAAAENTDLSKEQQQLMTEQAALEEQREAATAGITTDLITEYERLRKARLGLAVAPVKDGACTACGAELTAAQAQAARSPSKITNCVVCGRIVHG
jgi:predicted  nucleic acid-binding Zn-ribbon protein